MKIEMLRDFRVAADGFTVETWEVGSIHETTEQLGGDLVAAGVAKAVNPPSQATSDNRPARGRK